LYKLLNKFLISVFAAVFICSNFAASIEIKSEQTIEAQSLQEINETKDFQNKTIRVLISNKGSFDQKEVVLSAPDEIFITNGKEFVSNSIEPVTINTDGDYFIIKSNGTIKKVLINEKLFAISKANMIYVNNVTKLGKIAAYKGEIELSATKNNKIQIINITDIEDYIKGVVPNEMPVNFGLETLKAQAISARGYAYRDSSLKNPNYDVCDTTGSQVFNGYNSYDAISNKAVEQTMGQFALYNGNIILSLYSSTAGGYTENYENVFSQNGTVTKFPAEPIPYLKGVPDIDFGRDLSDERNAKVFYETKPESYDINSPKYRWEYTWNIRDLENILAKNLIKFSSSEFVRPHIKNRADFGTILNIDVPKRGVSGKAMYVRITTTKATFLIAKEIMIRRIFEYDNKWLPSANIVFSRLFDGKELSGFKVTGGGFGHGVGLSQYGAAGMAKKGFTYDKILKHYYSGISIGSFPVECNLKELKNCKTTFYSPHKNTSLIIKYSGKPSNLIFKINNTKITVNASNFDKKDGAVNLKKWIKTGINTVELVDADSNILDFSNHVVKFYVEIEGQDEK